MPVEHMFAVLLLLLPQPTMIFIRPRNLMSWEERGGGGGGGVIVALWWQQISLDKTGLAITAYGVGQASVVR